MTFDHPGLSSLPSHTIYPKHVINLLFNILVTVPIHRGISNLIVFGLSFFCSCYSGFQLSTDV